MKSLQCHGGMLVALAALFLGACVNTDSGQSPPGGAKTPGAALPTSTEIAVGANPARDAPVYPVTARVDVSDDYHGTTVADPYRWLENLDAETTRAWVEAQNRVSR